MTTSISSVKGYMSRDVPEQQSPDQGSPDRPGSTALVSEDRVRAPVQHLAVHQRRLRVSPSWPGICGAVVGSFYMMLVTLLLSVPLGVGAAIYLEEFAPKNTRWVDLIEVNVNNLAAVPSIVFGLLGLAVFLNLFGLPRSAPLVGGLTLTLMTLPIIVVATRAALRGVPPSIREAALGVGASKVQTVVPSRAAVRAARHHDRHDHRHGARARRDRAAADDRHGRIHRRHSGRPALVRRPRCRSRSSSGPTAPSGRSPSGPRPRSWCCSCFLIAMNAPCGLPQTEVPDPMVAALRTAAVAFERAIAARRRHRGHGAR